ncbi:MAG: polymer-forming cytoskeletal protein [Steroidobacteraceae bacterium]
MFGKDKALKLRVDTLIGAGSRIDGDLVFEGGLHLDGRVTGNVRGEGGAAATLSVSEQGHIEGSVAAQNVVLNGTVNGDIHAAARVVLGPRARVEGSVHYGQIEMALGAEIRGRLVPTGATGSPQVVEDAAAATGRYTVTEAPG